MAGRRKDVRLEDIAREAGVSRQTVGAVLLGGRTNTRAGKETIHRIQEASRRLNYKPYPGARLPDSDASSMIGILTDTIVDPTHSRILAGLMELLKERGMGATLLSLDLDHHGLALASLARMGLDGLLVVDQRFFQRPIALKELLQAFPRTVLYSCSYIQPELGTHFVDVDREGATRMAVGHLYKRGCRRIALFGGSLQLESQKARLRGYQAELGVLDLPFNAALVQMCPWAQWLPLGELPADGPQKLKQLIEKLVGEQRADGIVIGTEPAPLAVGLARQIQHMQYRIPEDVALVAVRSDPVYGYLHPRLTAVKLHHDAVAQPMIQMLEQMLQFDSHLRLRGNVLVEPELLVRESA